MPSEADPAFLSAVEKAYLSAVAKLRPESTRAQLTLHSELLEEAIYRADPTNGGIRFKKTEGAHELEVRLQRALSRKLIER